MIRFGRIARSAWCFYGLLVLASVVYGGGLLTGLDDWGRGDWDQFTFRFATPRTAMLRDGQLPLWNPYVNGGNVLLAHPHCPAFSPWYLLTLTLGAPLGLRVGVLMFVALGTTGMAALLRRWGVSRAGSLLGGVLMMMSAHFTAHIAEGHLEWCVLGLMPWVMLCLVLAEKDWRFAVLGALVFASAWLYGSVYVVAIFAPAMGIWAALESVRTRSWQAVAGYGVAMGLSVLLGSVVLLPRLEFLSANPRKTELHERVAPSMLGRMALDPGQAELYRATRDVRNPSVDELIRLLPAWTQASAKPYETLKWYRLEVRLTTTSKWSNANVVLTNVPHLWFYEGHDAPDKTPARLSSLPPSGKGLRVVNPHPGEQAVGEATLYAQLPERGALLLVVEREDSGASRLVVTRDGEVLLDAVHADMTPADTANAHVFAIRRNALLGSGAAPPQQNTTWCRLEVTLKTTADWCKVEVVNCPYLFQVRSPQDETACGARWATSSMDVSRHRPDGKEIVRRARLLLQMPENDDVRLAITQSPRGASTLMLRSPEGELLETTCTETTQPGGEKTRDYVLANRTIRARLGAVTEPMRWRLDEMGMTYDWHEYACYVTWLGLAMAAVGVVVAFRRQWPLLAIGLVSVCIVLGASLPVNVWGLWKLLPLYGSLQGPSRFLMVVIFAAAVCSGYGVDRLGCWMEKAGGVWLRHLVTGGVIVAVYLELAVLGWTLFSDVFVCPKRPVSGHQSRQFAQRYAEEEVRYGAMYSNHYPYLCDNSGVLREYENIAIPRGKIRLTTDPDYRGEAYLEGPGGTAQITDWTMSRVQVAVETPGPDRLVLNQNYFPGWKAVRRDAGGVDQRLPAQRTSDGLVSIPVNVGDREVTFYYRPDGLLWGAAVSGLTLLGCLGSLVAGSRGSRKAGGVSRVVAGVAAAWRLLGPSRIGGCLTMAVLLNLPFLACHPAWTLVDAALVRSLAVNFVLFLAPGLPLVGAMIGRHWLARGGLLWVISTSLAVFVAMLAILLVAGVPVGASLMWNATWVITNLAVAANYAVGGPPAGGLRLRGRPAWMAVLLFAVAYLAFYHGATRVVPVLEDHDYETQGTAHSLLTHGQMRLLTDRNTVYCYAHPPLVHACIAASFLYYGQHDVLAYYDEAWERVRHAEKGEPFTPVVDHFFSVPRKRSLVRVRGRDEDDASPHRIVGVDGKGYVVEPPLPVKDNWFSGRRIPVRDMEVQMLYDHFRRNTRHRLPTRTPNVFLAALTVGLLGWWVTRTTGYPWLALLVSCAYAANPEIFVRSSYGGYFAVSNFILMHILLAVADRTSDPSRFSWSNCLLAGAFAGVANHKLVLLPVAVVAWQWIRAVPNVTPRRFAAALCHPVLLGFMAGTAAFWTYGLAVSPDVFWLEHVRYHLADRLLHYNPLGYGLYPTVPGLWLEFWQHTGYVLLPLGIVSLVLLCWGRWPGRKGSNEEAGGWRGMPGLWAVWMVLIAIAFSLVDWRQTKHLMPLMLPLHMAPIRWAASDRHRCLIMGVVFAALFVWNLQTLYGLAVDFFAFSITPAW